ncbi:MAG: CPBP family intramembrane metalloprotease [Candidatus Hodarchaeaceae archaeon]|nr:CPBP family intramembrane metalloprotease [Candidatus Hodarchaeaceae archaeon]
MVLKGDALRRAALRAVLTLLLLSLPLMLADLIQRLRITYLPELRVDEILALSGMTLFGLFAVLKLTDRRALVRPGKRNSAREFAAGTAILACMDVLGLLAANLILFEGVVSTGAGVGLFFLWFAVIIGPLGEEWIFRHVLISGLRRVGRGLKRLPPIYVCVAASALIFGLAHLFDPTIKRSLADIPPIAYSGALYGVGYVKYGLASAILLHALGNLAVALLL